MICEKTQNKIFVQQGLVINDSTWLAISDSTSAFMLLLITNPCCSREFFGKAILTAGILNG